MPKKKKEKAEPEAKVTKYLVKDTNDRDFTLNGIDLKLEANVAKEVDAKLAKELKEKFPYLEISPL